MNLGKITKSIAMHFVASAKVVALILISFFCTSHLLYAQQMISINNETGLRNARYLSPSEVANNYLGKSEQARTFDFNPQLNTLTASNEGDVLLLDFFDDRQYQATIKRVSRDVNGVLGITAQVAGVDFGTCYISVTHNDILINTELPEQNEFYHATGTSGEGRLSQYALTELSRDRMPSESITPPEIIHPDQSASSAQSRMSKAPAETMASCKNTITNESASATIKVLVVYTLQANAYIKTQSTTMNVAINLAMQKSNEASVNSKLGITFELAHSYQTTYSEVNSDDDLYNLTNMNDGKLDEVHALRRQYDADLVMLVPKVEFTGGLGWRLNNTNGSPGYGFALSRVQQLSWTYTMVHEMAHNMGCGHHIYQTSSPGPGLHPYSAGWAGSGTGGKICTIMTYGGSQYWADKSFYTEIPYFSDPNITHQGVKIGNTETADNARTLRQTKHITAFYSDIIDNTALTSLTVNGTSVAGFNPDIHNYTVNVSTETATVQGVTNSCSSVSGNVTNRALSFGNNQILIIVTSSDGTYSVTYTLNVVREVPACASYASRPAFPATVTAQTGENALNLGLSAATPSQAKTSFNVSPTENKLFHARASETSSTCTEGWTASSGYTKLQVDKTGNYTFIVSTLFSIYSSSTISCSSFVASNGYKTSSGVSYSYAYTVSLEKDKVYYFRQYFSLSDITLSSAAGTLYVESDIPAGMGYTYIAVSNTDSEIKGQSAAADFRSLPAGAYTIYGVPYSSAGTNPTTFVGKTVAEIQSSACAILSSTSMQMIVESNSSSQFTVTIASTTNGTVSASSTSTEVGNSITLTIAPSPGYELNAIKVFKTSDESTTVPLFGSGSIRAFTMPAHSVTVSATFQKTTDQTAAETAKSLIESMTNVLVAQETANTESAVKTWLAGQINALPGFLATRIAVSASQITLSSFASATAGTSGNVSGTNGSFDFTVSLQKGSSTTQTTSTKNGTIQATAYIPPTAYAVTIASTTNGMVSATPTSAEVGNSITLTIAPSPGYELNAIKVFKTGEESTTVALSGNGSTRTFTMPAYGVTVSATFQKTADQTAAETAKSLIESMTDVLVAQETANTESAVKTWLAGQINALPGFLATRIAVSASQITLSGFSSATAGTSGNVSGTNGSFDFTVSLQKGSSTTQTTSTKNGTIQAIPYIIVPQKNISLSLADDLLVTIQNTGNVETGTLYLHLEGEHPEAFTLPQASIESILVEQQRDVLLSVKDDLTDGDYRSTLVVSDNDELTASIQLLYTVDYSDMNALQKKSWKIWVYNGSLFIDGLEIGERWSIFSVTGTLVYSDVAKEETANIALPQKGVYVIRASSGKAMKVIVH